MSGTLQEGSLVLGVLVGEGLFAGRDEKECDTKR